MGNCFEINKVLLSITSINTTHGCWGGGGVGGEFTPPHGQKVNVTGIPTPESKSKLITYRYRQKTPQGFFPSPRMINTFSLIYVYCVIPSRYFLVLTKLITSLNMIYTNFLKKDAFELPLIFYF